MRSESRATSTFYRRRGKRLLDLVFAVPALAVAMPVIVLASLGVAAALGRPVIFAQERPGLGGRTFWFHQFRTMTFERDSAGELLNVGSISVGPKSSQSGSSIGRSRDVAEIINVERSAVIATRVDGLRVGTLD